jgi:hypothetical protein
MNQTVKRGRSLKMGVIRVLEDFMGYIGLLLNAPYKIDSMMG